MTRVRTPGSKNQRSKTQTSPHPEAGPRASQVEATLDDGSLTMPGAEITLAMIQALIPLGLRAVGEALQAEVAALAGARYAHDDGRPEVVRWHRTGPLSADMHSRHRLAASDPQAQHTPEGIGPACPLATGPIRVRACLGPPGVGKTHLGLRRLRTVPEHQTSAVTPSHESPS